jgi:ABC-type lipoprotein release transport system permease subunit
MVLTFLNLVIVSGILVGLLQGAVDAVKTQYTNDIIISNLKTKSYIEHTHEITKLIDSLPQVDAYAVRYLSGATFEANYKQRTKFDEKPNVASANIAGIDPSAEDALTGLSKYVIEGEYLEPGDYDKILLGSYLDSKYLPIESPGFQTLYNVSPGTKIRMTTNGVTREVTIKGIIKTKVDEVSFRVYMLQDQLRTMIGREDGNASEISIRLKPGADPAEVRDIIKQSGFDKYAKIQTYIDAQPKFIKDMIATFSLLGNMMSSIGLVVASITIFIVIFINALTRRKFIGILKGIGITGESIEISYILQSIFYAICGSIIGLIIVYAFLEPGLRAHPIDFPFSDGILVANVGETLFRMFLLIITTLIAGYIPARMIVRKNTLDSILGRK